MGTIQSQSMMRRKCLDLEYACIKASLLLSSFFFCSICNFSCSLAYPHSQKHFFLLFYFFSSSINTQTHIHSRSINNYTFTTPPTTTPNN